MRFAIPLLVLAGLLVFLGLGLRMDPREVPSTRIGQPMPAFDLAGLNGDPPRVTQGDLVGRPMLVNFFASWCAGCRVEHPLLMQLAKGGVEIVGVDYKDTDDAGADWLSRHGNPYRRVIADPQGYAGFDWGVYGVPETFVIDARGIIVHKQIGPLTADAWRQTIAPLLGLAVAAPGGGS